ncbi:hypothetical protein BDV11DRAFT_91631 [Aspergillus similis]
MTESTDLISMASHTPIDALVSSPSSRERRIPIHLHPTLCIGHALPGLGFLNFLSMWARLLSLYVLYLSARIVTSGFFVRALFCPPSSLTYRCHAYFYTWPCTQ